VDLLLCLGRSLDCKRLAPAWPIRAGSGQRFDERESEKSARCPRLKQDFDGRGGRDLEGSGRLDDAATPRCLVLRRLLGAQDLAVERSDLAWRALNLYEEGVADFSDYVIGLCGREEKATVTCTFDRRAAKSPLFRLVAASRERFVSSSR
jgi:hypothetical protein